MGKECARDTCSRLYDDTLDACICRRHKIADDNDDNGDKAASALRPCYCWFGTAPTAKASVGPAKASPIHQCHRASGHCLPVPASYRSLPVALSSALKCVIVVVVASYLARDGQLRLGHYVGRSRKQHGACMYIHIRPMFTAQEETYPVLLLHTEYTHDKQPREPTNHCHKSLAAKSGLSALPCCCSFLHSTFWPYCRPFFLFIGIRSHYGPSFFPCLSSVS